MNKDMIRVYFAFLIILKHCDTCSGKFTNEFLLKISTSNDEQLVKKNVKDSGLTYVKKFGSDVYRVKDDSLPKENNGTSLDTGNIASLLRFYGHKVTEVEQQETMYVRFGYPQETPDYLRGYFEYIRKKRRSEMRQCPPYYEMHIERAWSQGYTGSDVTIAVLDVGLDASHEELQRNFNKKLSYNLLGDDDKVEPQSFPSYPEFKKITNHGNEMACLIAATKGNELCSAGVAFNASLVGLKLFEFENPSSGHGYRLNINKLSLALSYHIQSVDIYSCSFAVTGIFGSLQMDVTEALRQGVTDGRHGKGSVFVFPAGDNRGSVFDCNLDPLVNSIYTFTIASVGVNGSIPKYAIPCAATLASTNGDGHLFHEDEMITCFHGNSCKEAANGVSAATAIGAAIIALALGANNNLTWRDLQHIIIKSSSLASLDSKHLSSVNGAGLQFHRFFGYGLMNATMMTLMATNWTNVAPQETYSVKWAHKPVIKSLGVKAVIEVSDDPFCIDSLEHVMASVDFETADLRFTDLRLISPSRTVSIILDSSMNKINIKYLKQHWNFTSTQFWGEIPFGKWELHLILTRKPEKKLPTIYNFELTLFGQKKAPNCSITNETKEHKPENDRPPEAENTHVNETLTIPLGLVGWFLFLPLCVIGIILLLYGFCRY